METDPVLRAFDALEASSFSDDDLAQRYSSIQDHIERQEWAQALDDGFLLVGANPWERAYQLALGHCLHHLGEYEAAGRMYGLALLLDATDAACAYRVGECLAAMSHLADAREAFETAIKLSVLDPEYGEVRVEAEQRLAELAQLGA